MSVRAGDGSAAAFQPIVLRAPGGAVAEVYPHGAHVASWTPAGARESRLFLSRLTELRGGAAIRGGIPVVFPQFAAEGPLPKHGFARVRAWSLVDGPSADAAGASVTLRLTADEATRAIWPYEFSAEIAVRIEGRELAVALSVLNTGNEPFHFTGALHTYVRVRDAGRATVHGLRGVTYRDSAAGNIERIDDDPAIAITGEVDRVYLDPPPRVEVRDGGETTRVEMLGFRDTVVWNPGPQRAAKLADLEPGGERHMLCIEAATVRTPVVVAVGERWRGSQTLTAL